MAERLAAAAGGQPDPAGADERSTKYVVSRSDDPVEWQNSELLQGDAAETVADLKAREERQHRDPRQRAS